MGFLLVKTFLFKKRSLIAGWRFLQNYFFEKFRKIFLKIINFLKKCWNLKVEVVFLQKLSNFCKKNAPFVLSGSCPCISCVY